MKKKKTRKNLLCDTNCFLFVSHTALLKQIFQVILWQTVLCNTPLNVCQMRVVSTSLFFWSQCTPSVKSLFQLSAPLRLIEPGCLPKRLSVHQSVSGECGRFFVVNFLSSISQTIPQEPYSLILPLYVAFSSEGPGQSQTEDAFDTGSVTESAGFFPEKGFFLFSSPGQSQSPEQVLMEQFEETAGKDEQPPSSEMQRSALILLRPLFIERCCCSAAGWNVGEWVASVYQRCKQPTTSWDLSQLLRDLSLLRSATAESYFFRKDGSIQVCLLNLVMTPLDTAVCV